MSKFYSSLRKYHNDKHAKYLYYLMRNTSSLNERQYYRKKYNSAITKCLCQSSCNKENVKCIKCIEEKDVKICNNHYKYQEQVDEMFNYVVGVALIVGVGCAISIMSKK